MIPVTVSGVVYDYDWVSISPPPGRSGSWSHIECSGDNDVEADIYGPDGGYSYLWLDYSIQTVNFGSNGGGYTGVEGTGPARAAPGELCAIQTKPAPGPLWARKICSDFVEASGTGGERGSRSFALGGGLLPGEELTDRRA